MFTTTSNIARHARIIVTPTPTTLLESTAILKALQTFGPVSTFLNPRYVPALKDGPHNIFYAIFTETKSLEDVKVASPLAFEVGQDAADPKEVDPFNLRGLWSRRQVERKKFLCDVHQDCRKSYQNHHQRIIKENVYHGPFRLDRLAVSFEDLMKQGVPLAELADCFQKRPMDENDRAKFEAEALRRSFYRADGIGQNWGGLMDTWRESTKTQGDIGTREDGKTKV